MGDETISLRAIADGYCRNVETLEQELTQLASKVSELAGEVDHQKREREAARALSDALKRSQAAKESERETIKAEFAEASLENATNRMQTIRKRNRELVAELEDIEGQISNAGAQREPNDLAERAALLQVAVERLEKRLPKPYYNTSANLNPLLEGVGQVLHDDAQRLRKWHTSIKVPAIYDKATIGKARAAGGRPYHLYEERRLQAKEEQRRQEMQRYEGVQGSTDAVHAAMSRKPKPQPTVSTTSGVLSGEEVREALAAKKSA